LQLRITSLGALESLYLGPAALCVGEDRLDRAAVLALEAVQGLESLLDRDQPPRVGIDSLQVGAKLAGDVADLDGKRSNAFSDPIQLRVHTGDFAHAALRLRER